MRRWERARQGEGQLVLIVGEPGLGKSRLVEEFHARLRETPHTWGEWNCSQLLQNTPLHPIADWGRQRFGGADVPAEKRLADLENLLDLVKLDSAENAPLLAPLLDIPLPKEPVSTLTPEELRRRQLAALTNLVIAGARTQPAVLACEDLQWADPTTLDVLRGIAERGALAPLCIVATTRPEFRPPWGIRSHHGTISLAPLDRAQVRDMVAELSARHALSRDAVDEVAARTGGVPLFVEEVTRLLLERGEQGGTHAIPPTLQQSLMARLDRVGPAREVAQIGSVIGRGFSYKLLKVVAGMEDAPLEAALEKLSDADIVLVEGDLPDSNYRFKHALIQDAAYENLLKSRRQVLHRRVAETLRDRFPDTAAAAPEMLAHHFRQAGLTDAAIEWWGKAGDQALRRSAFQEAIAHLGKAIAMADKATGGKAALAGLGASEPVAAELKRRETRSNLHAGYALATMMTKGFAAEETKTALARAASVPGAVRTPEYWTLVNGRINADMMHGDHRAARAGAEAFLAEAEAAGLPGHAAFARRMLGFLKLLAGDFADARADLERALADYDERYDESFRTVFALDLRSNTLRHLGMTAWFLGDTGEAERLTGEAIRRAKDTGQPGSYANALFNRLLIGGFCGRAEEVLPAAEEIRALAEEHGLKFWRAIASSYADWAHVRMGEPRADAFRAGLGAYADLGARMHEANALVLLAEVELAVGRRNEALTAVERGLALAAETGLGMVRPWLLRLRGDALAETNPAQAASAYREALSVADAHGSRALALLAALALARLLQSTGEAVEVHAALAPALEGFAPTPLFPAIAEAQELLATQPS
jgi:tetratricopeptide (TPR) repeat protein